jgi:hypothetical protein
MSAAIREPAAGAVSVPTPAYRAHRRSAAFLRWLRAIHLYVGLWGAGLGFFFGATGMLMSHRAIMKIPVEKVVQRSAQLQLPDPSLHRFASADDMAQWLRTELKFDNAAHIRVKTDPPKRVIWADREVEQPARWTFNLQSPKRGLSAEYFVGNRFIKVEMQDATPIGTLMRLHTSNGVSAFWVLLADTISGGLLVLSVTGLLLWSRLRPIKLSTVTLALSALLASAFYLWSVA